MTETSRSRELKGCNYLLLTILIVILGSFCSCKFADFALRIKDGDLLHQAGTTVLTNTVSKLPGQ